MVIRKTDKRKIYAINLSIHIQFKFLKMQLYQEFKTWELPLIEEYCSAFPKMGELVTNLQSSNMSQAQGLAEEGRLRKSYIVNK